MSALRILVPVKRVIDYAVSDEVVEERIGGQRGKTEAKVRTKD